MTATAPPTVVTLTTWAQAYEAYRRKELRQAMYDEGWVVMADCLLNLHGDAHRQRRRLENRLFRRDVFRHWEQDLLGPTIDATLAPFVAQGSADLVVLGYRCAMNLTAAIAGVDHDATDPASTERLYAYVRAFSEGATVVHSTRDRDQVRAEVLAEIERFDTELLQPSIARRRALLADDPDRAPRDVLTTLLANDDRLDLPPETIRREVCFYLQAGAHSTANAFTHAVDSTLRWGEVHPIDLARARTDRGLVQRCVHEALRLHPASPVAWRTPLVDVTLADGTVLPKGSRVVIDLVAANRDPTVWGPDADHFDPCRTAPDGVPPWGHSFGGGTHACIGTELDGGLDPAAGLSPPEHLYGTVAVMVSRFLGAGGRADPHRPPALDPTSTRRHFSTYPVVFDR